jgi:hypothetical protein
MNILHAITLAALLHHAPMTAPVCHKGTVSYKFVGTPGATFVYAGDRYSIPANGSIELLTSDTVYLAANGRSMSGRSMRSELGRFRCRRRRPVPQANRLPRSIR